MNIDKFVKAYGCFRGVEIPGFREHCVPVAQAILRNARHLSAHRLAYEVGAPGIDYRGCPKGQCAAAIARGLCGIPKLYVGCSEANELKPAVAADPESVERVCRDLRLCRNGYNRAYRSCGKPAPLESDRPFIEARLADPKGLGYQEGDDLRACLDALDCR